VPTKTKSSVRSVPLGQVVVAVLAAHLAKYPAADDGSIFTNERGRPLTYELWKSVWKATGATFKTHDLRHYAASALIAGGVGEAGLVDPGPCVASDHARRVLAPVAGR
jgi:integrase